MVLYEVLATKALHVWCINGTNGLRIGVFGTFIPPMPTIGGLNTTSHEIMLNLIRVTVINSRGAPAVIATGPAGTRS